MILGRAGVGKTARIFEEIAGRVRAGQGGLVLLVPEQYSHEAERELCRAAGDSLSLCGEVLSFTGLARKVLSRTGGARPMMDGGGRLLCMAVAAGAVYGSLTVYRRCGRDGRMLESLARGVEELRNADLGAGELLAASERFPGMLGDKLRDLALLMEGYTAAQSRSAADPADVLETLAAAVGESGAAGERFYVDGFSDFTELEKNVLRQIIRAGHELTVCLTCARDGASEEIFSLPRETARWLRRTAEELGVPCREEWMDPEGAEEPLRYLCDHLFDFAGEGAPDAGGTIRLIEAADPYEECELAAARMAELARQGVRWREMAAAVRGFGDYRAALESACARYGVPLFLSGRGDMLRRSIPLLITSALEAVLRGYEYEAVFGYLKTGLAPVPASCDRLENYVILWNIRGSMWERPFTLHPGGYNQKPDEASDALLAELNEQRMAVILPLKRLEIAVRGAADAAGQAKALADFLTDIRLPERLERRAAELERAGRAEAAAEYGQLWDIVCAALEQFAAVLGDMPMDGHRFRELFSLMLSKYDVGVIPVSLDRVQAGDLQGMRRRHISHLFLLGAADGRLPAPKEEAGVFTAEEREELSGMGLALDSPEKELSREFWLIYSCLSLPSASLYMSCPAVDGEGTEMRPSMVMTRAETLFGLARTRGDLTRARTFSREAAFTLAVRGEAGAREPLCAAARAYFRQNGRGEELTALVRAAEAGRGSLGPAAVTALYGEKPALSATRAERFVNCRFSYFMQYGLKAKPRQPAVFDPRNYGTFMHYVLEHAAREVMELGGFHTVTEQQMGALADKYVDEYIHTELNDFAEKSARFEYLFRRLRTTVRRVTEDMWRELKDSRFQPLDLELDLTRRGVLAPGEDDGDIRLTGQADRVDGWVKDGVLYLRVVDYKTGEKKFDLSDVCEGINMQMLMYLFALTGRAGAYYQDLADEIRPAGVLYSPARFRPVKASGDLPDEELAALRRSAAQRSGLVLNDREVIEAMEPGAEKKYLPVKLNKDGEYTKNVATLAQFGALSRYIGSLLRDMAAELRAGSVAADPWFKNMQENACVFCDFAKACLFDETKDCRRARVSLSPDKAWEKIEGSHE